MRRPGRGLWRAGRASLVAVVIVLTSVLAHAAAGGGLPSALPCLSLFLAAWPLCWLLARRRLRVPTLTMLLTAGQLVTHVVATAWVAAGPGMDSSPMGTLGTGPSGMAASGMAVMVGAHATAALLLALVFAYADRALWRVWRAVAPPEVALPGPPAVVTLAPTAPLPERRPHWLLPRVNVRRGPPTATARALRWSIATV
ncbi:MAG: hypothetical protein ACTHNT_13845 [Actinomycetales bacterium]